MIPILERIRQGHRTIKFPKELPNLPEGFQGLPVLSSDKCETECKACVEACPTEALSAANSTVDHGPLSLDLGKCLFCGVCTKVCPAEGAIEFTKDYRLATQNRADLIVKDEQGHRQEVALRQELSRLFGRSLKLRQVSAGGCNGCEVEVNVLNTVVFDLARFGIQFVASPRHADGLLITGPVTQNMRQALIETYEAIPDPKICIAVGSCAIAGGPYYDHQEVCGGADKVVPIDLYIPGCPPHPITILDGLLRWLGKVRKGNLQI